MTPSVDEARLRRRYRLQVILGIACVILTAAAVILPVWVEEFTGLEPDGGSGEFEWILALIPGLLSIAFGALAYRTRRLLAHAG